MNLADMLAVWTRLEILGIVVLAILSILLWRVPVIGLLFYPFRLFYTFIHEICHGIAAVVTGGSFDRFVIHPNRSGMATLRGGSNWVVTCAGYLGTPLFGGALFMLTTSDIPARSVLLWLGILLGVLCLVFVRNLFGFFSGLLIAAILYLAGGRLEEDNAARLLLLLAVQLMLASLDGLLLLTRFAARVPRGVRSDAHDMATQTGIPAVLWALFWSMIAIVIVIGAVTLAYSDAPRY